MRQSGEGESDPRAWCAAVALAFLALLLVGLGVPTQPYFDETHYVPAARRLLEMRFRKAAACTIQEELQRTRLKRVRTLLAESNLSVTAIARTCGFTSKSYLGKVFRRTFGTTMTKYRVNR